MSAVLIVGASRGVGLEFVRQYRAGGAKVVATARGDEGLATIRQLGATALKLDVTEAASASGLARQIAGHQFDEVIIVAGVSGSGTSGLETPTAEEFDAVMHTNVLGPMRVLPQLPDCLAPGARLAIISS
jgi:NAD(P)-dependent dehydrogenase (short-subunit alcohol dehydrogenase family)